MDKEDKKFHAGGEKYTRNNFNLEGGLALESTLYVKKGTVPGKILDWTTKSRKLDETMIVTSFLKIGLFTLSCIPSQS